MQGRIIINKGSQTRRELSGELYGTVSISCGKRAQKTTRHDWGKVKLEIRPRKDGFSIRETITYK